MKGRIVQSLHDLLEVLHGNAACIGCGALRPMAGLMAQQGVNPEFSNVPALIPQFGRHLVSQWFVNWSGGEHCSPP